jgi:hypothetical protein
MAMKSFSFPVDPFPNLVTLDQGLSVTSNKNGERLAGQSVSLRMHWIGLAWNSLDNA